MTFPDMPIRTLAGLCHYSKHIMTLINKLNNMYYNFFILSWYTNNNVPLGYLWWHSGNCEMNQKKNWKNTENDIVLFWLQNTCWSTVKFHFAGKRTWWKFSSSHLSHLSAYKLSRPVQNVGSNRSYLRKQPSSSFLTSTLNPSAKTSGRAGRE